jgi:hypothetical protein
VNRKLLWEIKKELTRPITERDLKREERRSVFLLGMLAVIVTLRISATSSDKFTVLGIDYNLIPVLNILIYAWIAYAALMLVFISDDMSRRWTALRRLARLIGLGVAFETPLILLWVMVSTPTIFVIPVWLFGYVIVLPFVAPIIYLYVGVFRRVFRLIRSPRRDRRKTTQRDPVSSIEPAK